MFVGFSYDSKTRPTCDFAFCLLGVIAFLFLEAVYIGAPSGGGSPILEFRNWIAVAIWNIFFVIIGFRGLIANMWIY